MINISVIERARKSVVRSLWHVDLTAVSRRKAFVIKALRPLYVIVRGFTDAGLSLRATGLVYTTLLSMVPLLAVSFSVLKAFGVQNKIEPFVYDFLLPLGPKGNEIAAKIMQFIDNIRAGVLGSVGLAVLIYTVISLIQKVEEAFNYIWGVSSTRSFLRRFSDYTSIVLVGPVLVVSALGITASLMNASLVTTILPFGPVGDILNVIGKAVPFIIITAAFTFLYNFLPNTEVNLCSAAIGGIYGGALWEAAGWGFTAFVASSSNYPAIYSGFAIVILFMIWLYVGWLVLLVGAEISFHHQYPLSGAPGEERLKLNNLLREKAALFIMFLIGYNFFHGEKPWTVNSLAHRSGIHIDHLREIVSELEKTGLIAEAGHDSIHYLPSRSLEAISLTDILSSVRAPNHGGSDRFKINSVKEVNELSEKIETSIVNAVDQISLRDLVAGHKGKEP